MSGDCFGQWEHCIVDYCGISQNCMDEAANGAIVIIAEHQPNRYENTRAFPGVVLLEEETDPNPKACFGHGPCSILKNHKCEWASVCNDYLDEQGQAMVKGTIAIREEHKFRGHRFSSITVDDLAYFADWPDGCIIIQKES